MTFSDMNDLLDEVVMSSYISVISKRFLGNITPSLFPAEGGKGRKPNTCPNINLRLPGNVKTLDITCEEQLINSQITFKISAALWHVFAAGRYHFTHFVFFSSVFINKISYCNMS